MPRAGEVCGKEDDRRMKTKTTQSAIEAVRMLR